MNTWMNTWWCYPIKECMLFVTCRRIFHRALGFAKKAFQRRFCWSLLSWFYHHVILRLRTQYLKKWKRCQTLINTQCDDDDDLPCFFFHDLNWTKVKTWWWVSFKSPFEVSTFSSLTKLILNLFPSIFLFLNVLRGTMTCNYPRNQTINCFAINDWENDDHLSYHLVCHDFAVISL